MLNFNTSALYFPFIKVIHKIVLDIGKERGLNYSVKRKEPLIGKAFYYAHRFGVPAMFSPVKISGVYHDGNLDIEVKAKNEHKPMIKKHLEDFFRNNEAVKFKLDI